MCVPEVVCLPYREVAEATHTGASFKHSCVFCWSSDPGRVFGKVSMNERVNEQIIQRGYGSLSLWSRPVMSSPALRVARRPPNGCWKRFQVPERVQVKLPSTGGGKLSCWRLMGNINLSIKVTLVLAYFNFLQLVVSLTGSICQSFYFPYNTYGLANSLSSAFINDFLNSHSDKINNSLILANYTFVPH